MYGDGGAFPEIHMAQYPMNMGLNKNQTSNAIQLQVDADGKLKYDAIIKQNVKGSKVSRRISYLFDRLKREECSFVLKTDCLLKFC